MKIPFTTRVKAAATAFRAGISSPYELAQYLWGKRSSQSESGVQVTVDTAMRLAVVFACVRVLSEDIAALPLILYRRTADGRGKERVYDHWLAQLLEQPNGWQTGFEFREMQQAHLELGGNFYGLQTVVRGEIREVLPIAPWRVTPQLLPTYKLNYRVEFPDGTTKDVPPDRMYHARGLSLDGVTGLSPVGYNMETIGLGIAMVKYGAKLFKNGGLVRGMIERPADRTALSEPAETRLLEAFDNVYGGVDNAQKTMLLQEGMKYSLMGMKADEAQFLESKKLTRSEIAGLYRVPAHLINDLEKATFSNIEQQSIDYVQKALLPRLRRIEAHIKLRMLPVALRGSMFAEHLVDGLLRGDYATRQAGLLTATSGGWMTRNEARAFDNLNPGPPELDQFLVPNANAKPAEPPKPADPAKEQAA